MCTLYLDLDGLGADWVRYVTTVVEPKITIEQLNSMGDDDRDMLLTDLYLAHPRLFYCLPKIKKYQQLLDFADSHFNDWYILSAGAPTHASHMTVKRDKRLWLADMFEIPKHKSIVVRNNKDKSNYANGNILVDDFIKNCNLWESNGGKAVHAQTYTYDPMNIIAKVKKLF